MGRKWTEWVSGVTVNHDAPGAARTVLGRGLKWKWLMVSTVALPWCPLCGAVVAPKRHKYKGQTAMQIHERDCWERGGNDDDYDDDDELLQLESSEDNGTI